MAKEDIAYLVHLNGEWSALASRDSRPNKMRGKHTIRFSNVEIIEHLARVEWSPDPEWSAVKEQCEERKLTQ